MKAVAVIGAGYWGKNLVRNYFELGALHTVCDTRTEVLSAMQKNFPDVKFSSKFEDVLADNTVKAVVIALPAECHYEYTAKALRAGKDVFVEKPLALDLEHAKKLNAIALEEKKNPHGGALIAVSPCVPEIKGNHRQRGNWSYPIPVFNQAQFGENQKRGKCSLEFCAA